jgi:hypothetical protein
MGLMFVGGAAASTAGGIKVQTFSILAFAIVSSVRGGLSATRRVSARPSGAVGHRGHLLHPEPQRAAAARAGDFVGNVLDDAVVGVDGEHVVTEASELASDGGA